MRERAVLVADHGPVRQLILNRPERRNSLDLQDRRDLLAELASADENDACRAVLLNGADGVFCAGGDIRSMSPDPHVARMRLEVVNDLARALVYSRKPVVVAVEGGAFGLGLSLAAASDYVVAAKDSRFVASFAKLGLIADTGLYWSLSQRIGRGRAKELILFANAVSAEEALRTGLVSEVVPPGEVVQRALERAERLAAYAPGAVAGTKRIFAQDAQDLESVLASEADIQVDLLAGEDFAEGRAAFLERRTPVFAGD